MTICGTNKLSALQVKKVKPDPDKMYKLSDRGTLYLRNDNCFYEYLPNVIKKKLEPPSNIIAHDISHIDQLPKDITWAPTTDN